MYMFMLSILIRSMIHKDGHRQTDVYTDTDIGMDRHRHTNRDTHNVGHFITIQS